MSNRLGPLDVNCDAPPYAVVRACRRVGIQAPEDVRWCRMGTRAGHPTPAPGAPATPWMALLGMGPSAGPSCSCGQKLPTLDMVTFTFLSGAEATYLLGQCSRCRTVYWDEG